MSVERCIGEIERAVGRDLTPDELREMEGEIASTVRRLREQDIEDIDIALQQAMEARAGEIELLAWVEKRNALLNARAKGRMLAYVTSEWGDNPAAGLKAYIGGVESYRAGARESVDAAQQSLSNSYVNGMLTDLEAAGVLKEFRSGAFDRQIFEAAHARQRGDTDALGRIPAEARRMEEIISKYNQKSRLDANDAGAWIGELDGYVIPRNYDTFRVRRMGEAEFVRKMGERIDWQRSFPDAVDGQAQSRILRRLYSDFAAGVHLRSPKDGPASQLKGFSNIGRRMSHDRVIHFKSPADEFNHMRELGYGRIADSMVTHLDRMAHDTALMRKMGPNAEMNFQEVVSTMRNRLRDADAKARQRFESGVGRGVDGIERVLLPLITGEARMPGNHMFAKWSSGVRQVQQMSTLGGASIPTLGDTVFTAAEAAYQGGNFFGGLTRALGSLASGPYRPEDIRAAARLGITMDGLRGAVVSRFDVSDTYSNLMSRATTAFFKLNLLQPMTDRMRTSFSLGKGLDWYANRGKQWGGLKPEERRVLGLYNIQEPEWNVIRGAPGEDTGSWGRVLTPESLYDLPDTTFEAYVRGQNRNPTARNVREAREDLIQRFRSYYADRASHASLVPDARTRSFLLQGTRPGTPEGEFARHVAFLKGFPTTVLQKVIGREFYGRGNLRGQGVMFDDNPYASMASIVAFTTGLGYLTMSLRDIINGRKPRVPENREQSFAVFRAAMLQGGGLGIYGDFLFGEVRNRWGGTFVTTLVGPTIGQLDSVMDIYGRMVDGDDAAGQAFRFLYHNLPGSNLFYTKMLTDYLIAHRIQEMANPGSLRRAEQRAEREMGYEYWMRPSDHIPYGGF